MENLAKVMWLEEDLFAIEQFKEEAVSYGLDLQPFNCWEDARDVLKGDVKGWEAIILDPKCKLGRGDKPKPQKFLPQVLCDIVAISTERNKVIPWYVFTNCDPLLFEDLIVDDRRRFDASWERPYYSFGEDSKELFKRVKLQVSSLGRIKIREGVHKDFFDKLSRLTNCGFEYEDVVAMEDIFIFIYENIETKLCNFISLRKVIENLCKSMSRYNILPSELCNRSGELNVGSCVRMIAGMPCKQDDYSYVLVENPFDEIARQNLFNILKYCNGYAHSESIHHQPNKINTNKYLEATKTNNLLHSCALMLADVIIIYYDFLESCQMNASEKIYWTKTKCEQNLQTSECQEL